MDTTTGALNGIKSALDGIGSTLSSSIAGALSGIKNALTGTGGIPSSSPSAAFSGVTNISGSDKAATFFTGSVGLSHSGGGSSTGYMFGSYAAGTGSLVNPNFTTGQCDMFDSNGHFVVFSSGATWTLNVNTS